MESLQNFKISEENQFDYEYKTTFTPQTAESLEGNDNFSSHQKLTFSSFISEADKFFISQELQPQQNQSFSAQKNDEPEKQIYLLEKFIQTSLHQQTNEPKCEIILKSQTENEQQEIELTSKSMKIIIGDQLASLKVFTEIQIQQNKLINSKLKYVISEYLIKKNEIIEDYQNLKIFLRIKETEFEREIFNIDKISINKENLSLINPEKQIFIKYNGEKQQLTFVFPLQKYLSIQKLYYQLTNKSPLLNDVKSIQQLKGILIHLSQQNMGSRIIQKLIHLSPQETIKQLRRQLQGKFDILMMNKYGNYVVQKIFYYIDEKQRIEFLQNIEKSIAKISKTRFGTHCLQYFVKKCHKSFSCMNILEKAILSNMLQLSTDEFGTHFIQQILWYSKSRTIQTYFLIPSNLIINSHNRFGILTIKRLMQKICPSQSKQNEQKRTYFLSIVYNNFITIATNEYGHFLIQQLSKYYQHQTQLQWILYSVVSDISFYANNLFTFSIIRFYLDLYPNTWLSTIVHYVFCSDETILSLMMNKAGTLLLHKLLLQMTDNFTKSYMIKKINQLVNLLGDHQRKKKWKRFMANFK